MAALRFAFAGFRHGHIFSLVNKVRTCGETELVAACEEDAGTRTSLADGRQIEITHDTLDAMLAEIPFDVLAIGDSYGTRGSLAVRGLQAGKHVILDKPICTHIDEWLRIRALSAEKNLAVGCQLDMRGDPKRQTMRRIIRGGEIGEVMTVAFSGQHPLMLGSRPMWYFEEGKHGGTINDIAIHVMDAIPWLTGKDFAEVVAARAWNGKAVEYPHFKDCAQLMMTLSNGAGVIGDVSYLSPDVCGYKVRQYWRMTVHGTRGLAETRAGDNDIMLATDSDDEPRYIPAETVREEGYFEDFLNEVKGQPADDGLTTGIVLRASRIALVAQAAADSGETHVRL